MPKEQKTEGPAAEQVPASDQPVGTPPGGGSWKWENGGWVPNE